MSRRLRLALLMAVIAAAAPSPSAPYTFAAARTGVSIAWFRADQASNPQRQRISQTIRVVAAVRLEPIAHRDLVLPDTLRLHSLYQRPPPPHS